MQNFEVWAPNGEITSMDVVIDGFEHPMSRDEQGRWHADLESAGPGTKYEFRLNHDLEQTYPDPRSRWQPEGSHGPSVVVDHAHGWTDGEWRPPELSEAVLYELHIGTFTSGGTYRDAVEKLPYLKALGITHIELMPVHQASGSRNWGYDGVYLYAPYAAYGSPGELKDFVDRCHAHGLAILLDVVYNHLGPEGNHAGRFGPYNKDEHTPWGEAINLDGPGSDHVRSFIIDNALMWLEDYHFDGLRIDAMDELRDRSALHLMEELSERVEALSGKIGRNLVLTAEFDQNDPRIVTSREKGGLGLDAQWVDNFHHSLLTLLSGDRRSYYHDFGSMELLAKALKQAVVFDGQYSEYRNKRLGRPYRQISADHFIVFNANHDQVGNRPLGDRPGHRIDIERVKIGAALTILSRFVPMLFQGEEWGASTPFQFFTDHRDAHVAEATMKGRANSFGDYGLHPEQIPNPQDAKTFERSKLDWSDLEKNEHASVLAWHRGLIALRHSVPGFGKSAAAEVTFDADAQWLVMRHSGVAVACNFADMAQIVPVAGAERTIVLASRPGCSTTGGGVELPGNTATVLAGETICRSLPVQIPGPPVL